MASRGLAHLVVLQVLENEQISIDLIAGTSVGGTIAGLDAAGVSSSERIASSERTGLIDLASVL